MNRQARALAAVLFVLTMGTPSAGVAGALGNVSYTSAELQQPIAFFNASNFIVGPAGSNTALALREVFIVMGSYDSGKPPGALHVFDVKDPRKPRLLKTLSGTPETNNLRELHAMPVAIIDGKDFLALPTTAGVRFFDFTDPMNPRPSGALSLSGVNGGDYDNAAWQLSWSWPYLFVGGTGNGVYIVDATNPASPTMVGTIPVGQLGNFRIGPVHAAGNYLVVSGMDQGPTKISVIDVSNPRAPFLLATGSAPREMYSAVVIGDRIFGTGADGYYSFMRWTPTAVTMIAEKKFGADKGGYCTYQDGFAFCGQSSEGYRKLDMRDETNIREVGHGDIPNDSAADTDFATVLGNLVFLGNDHGTGSAFIPHSMAPDTTAPTVVNVYPGDQELRVPLTTRVTIFFSDEIDIATLTTSNIVVRTSAGTPVPGVFTHSSFNAVSFGPRQPLQANTTYEVVVPAAGLKDLSGNPIASTTMVRFATGASLQPPGSGTGGAGGAGGRAGAGGGGGTGGRGGASGGAAGAGASSATGGTGQSGGVGGTGAGGTAGGPSGGAGGASGTGGGAGITGTGGAGGALVAGGGGGPGTGGAPATGGATGSGGGAGAAVVTGSAGATASGGSGGPGAAGDSTGGCACSAAPHTPPAGVLSTVSLIFLAVVARRRRVR